MTSILYLLNQKRLVTMKGCDSIFTLSSGGIVTEYDGDHCPLLANLIGKIKSSVRNNFVVPEVAVCREQRDSRRFGGVLNGRFTVCFPRVIALSISFHQIIARRRSKIMVRSFLLVINHTRIQTLEWIHETSCRIATNFNEKCSVLNQKACLYPSKSAEKHGQQQKLIITTIVFPFHWRLYKATGHDITPATSTLTALSSGGKVIEFPHRASKSLLTDVTASFPTNTSSHPTTCPILTAATFGCNFGKGQIYLWTSLTTSFKS